jgi:DNA-binding MarR family transcriptional regulator
MPGNEIGEKHSSSASSYEDVISKLVSDANALFAGEAKGESAPLQHVLDSLTAKVVGTAFEIFREEYDHLVRMLRNAYGQIARFVKGDFRQDAGFYLGQLHALTEVTYRLGHQRVPREALNVVARSKIRASILKKVAEERSIGAGDLARALGKEEPNLSSECKHLVQHELLRRDRFGRSVRYSTTPLTLAVLAELGSNSGTTGDEQKMEPEQPKAAATIKTPDWPQMAMSAAAASMTPGKNVMANTDDFMSGILALAAVGGATSVAIARSGRHVRLLGTGHKKRAKLCLPPSVGKSLSDQVKACSTLPGHAKSTGGKQVFDWKGEEFVIEGEPTDENLKVEFVHKPDPAKSKTKVQVAFQEIRENKERLVEFEKIYLREIMEECKWKEGQAANILGLNRPKLALLIKELKISKDARPVAEEEPAEMAAL